MRNAPLAFFHGAIIGLYSMEYSLHQQAIEHGFARTILKQGIGHGNK